jgi:phosphoesterase RecJ-like protein
VQGILFSTIIMKSINQINQVVQHLEKARNIIIVTHRNPDGDAIGSSFGLAEFLKHLGKKAKVILNDPVPENLQFLTGAEQAEIYDKEKHFEDFLMCDTICILDLNAKKRMDRLQDAVLAASATKILIDHHEEPEYIGNMMMSVPEVISTSNLIFDIIEMMEKSYPKSTAEALYVGIMTDSGSFRFPRTNARTHEVIGKLINAGADPTELYEQVNNQNQFAATQIFGAALSNMTLHLNGKVCIMMITAEMFNKCGANNAMVDNFASETLKIKGVIAGAMISDMDSKDEVRISLRSKGDFSVQEVAKKIGGGGHFHASGAREFNLDIYKTKEMLIEVFGQELAKQGL